MVILFSVAYSSLLAQEQAEQPEAPEPIVKLGYFNKNNSLQYLMLQSQLKTGKKYDPRANISYRVYLDSASEENLIAKVKSDINGKAKIIIPPTLKSQWDASALHNFIVVEEPVAKDGEETISEFPVTKAKISIDTVYEDGIRSIAVSVMKYENDAWVPANEVEMIVGVQRLGGVLSAGEENTYTTDSSGVVTVEFNKKNLPGNDKGEIQLVARVDDNEFFGNLLVEKTVGWGVPGVHDDSFFTKRSLWSRGNRPPYWLMFMATGIIIAVWGTLIYLVIQLFKIKKLGTSHS